MAVEQLHYTSVKAGPGGSSGFQFVKLTGGVDAALCRQVQPLLGYEPPRGAPARPTPQDIAAFPVALSYVLLPHGGAVLCNTAYTGADYSGRYGNFYAHALYLPGGPADLGGLLPIQTWRSPSWCKRPDDPAHAAGSGAVMRGTITDGALYGLARQHAARLEGFLADVLNIFRSPPTRILLVDADTDIAALWIALACRSLPRDLAGRLTFTTYTQRPYLSPHQVAGIPADADFAFSTAEITSQYRVHDSGSGRSSPPAPPSAWATAAAALWQAGRAELFDEAYHGLRLKGPVLDGAQAHTLTGQLAAAAMAHDVDVPAAVFAATVTWAENHPGEGTEQFWRNFAAAAGQGRGEIPAEALGRLCQDVSRRWPGAVTEPLLGAYLAAAPAALLDDPHLDTGTLRWAISRAAGHPGAAGPAGDALRQILPRAFQPDLVFARGLVLLELADALQVSDVPMQAASELLGPALLAGGDRATAAAAFLDATSNDTLREHVLDCLHDQAHSDTGLSAAQLADAVAGWTRPADLATDYPLLHAAADLQQAWQARQVTGPAAAFCRVMHVLEAADLPDPSSCAWRLASPGQALTAREASDMLSCTPARPGQVTYLDHICLGLIRTAELSTDILELALHLRARTGEWPDPRDTALLELLEATARLQATGRQRDSPATSRDVTATIGLLGTASPLPQPVRDAAVAAVLAVLLSPVRLEAGSPGLDRELHELAVSGDDGLIAAYAGQAARDLPRTLMDSPALHASCFCLWWREEGLPAATAWHQAQHDLVVNLLGPTARTMTSQAQAQTAAELERRQEGLSQHWLPLTQRPPAPRPTPLAWARHMIRKTLR